MNKHKNQYGYIIPLVYIKKKLFMIKYRIRRNFSEDLILTLLARLCSSLKLCITSTSLFGNSVVYNMITCIKNR